MKYEPFFWKQLYFIFNNFDSYDVVFGKTKDDIVLFT